MVNQGFFSLFLASQVKPLIKTSDNRMSFTSKINENKIVKESIYNKIMSQYKMSLFGWRVASARNCNIDRVSQEMFFKVVIKSGI